MHYISVKLYLGKYFFSWELESDGPSFKDSKVAGYRCDNICFICHIRANTLK